MSWSELLKAEAETKSRLDEVMIVDVLAEDQEEMKVRKGGYDSFMVSIYMEPRG